VPFVVAGEINIAEATEITGKGVTRALIRMNRAVGLKFSAPPTVIVEGTTKKLDIVCDKESRNFLGQIGEMTDGGVDFGYSILKATVTEVSEVITTKVTRVGSEPTNTIGNEKVFDKEIFG
jgi:hypothetical protein